MEDSHIADLTSLGEGKYIFGVFDGHDVYNVQGEQDQLSDEDPTNNAYWWVDMATGLKPHLLDLGIPQYSPGSLGDCYYAILGLPSDSSNMGGESDGENDIKLVHSRRFGSELGNEWVVIWGTIG